MRRCVVKVDLDDLKAKAKAAACPGRWAISEPVQTEHASEPLYNVLTEADGAPMFEYCIKEHAEYAIAARVDVVLAMIRRIRELEAGLMNAAAVLELPHTGPQMRADHAAEARELVAKGACR